MPPISPATVALGGMTLVMVTGFLAYWIRQLRLFAGFRTLRRSILLLARRLRAQVSRVDDRLLLAGRAEGWPVLLRLSRAGDSLLAEVCLQATMPVVLAVAEKGSATSGSVVAAGGFSEGFQSRYAVSSARPSLAEVFLADKTVKTHIEKFFDAPGSSLELKPDCLQLHQPLAEDAPAQVVDAVKALAELASAAMPLGKVTARPAPEGRGKQSSWLRVPALAFGLTIAATLIAYKLQPLPTAAATPAPAAEQPLEIVSLKNWRLAAAAEFDAGFIEWLRQSGQEPASRITLESDSDGAAKQVGYLLVGADGSKRVVLMVNNAIVYDSRFPSLAGIAKVGKSAVETLDWSDGAPSAGPCRGEGLLVVSDAIQAGSGRVFCFSEDRLHSTVPTNYRDLGP